VVKAYYCREGFGKSRNDGSYYAAVGEIHGLAQRGGSVIGFVRISENPVASTVPEGTADLLLSFEPLEAIRYINYAKKGTTFIVNEQRWFLYRQTWVACLSAFRRDSQKPRGVWALSYV